MVDANVRDQSQRIIGVLGKIGKSKGLDSSI
jgi:hypothetical protein